MTFMEYEGTNNITVRIESNTIFTEAKFIIFNDLMCKQCCQMNFHNVHAVHVQKFTNHPSMFTTV